MDKPGRLDPAQNKTSVEPFAPRSSEFYRSSWLAAQDLPCAGPRDGSLVVVVGKQADDPSREEEECMSARFQVTPGGTS
jgi:hypothetical protein